MRVLLYLILILTGCRSGHETNPLQILQGTWQVEGREKYEQWQLTSKRELEGKSYRLVDGKEQITENLKIKNDGVETIYQATVPNQNDGRTIPFVLNKQVTDTLSFENPGHDFPTRIQYLVRSRDELFVQVLGPDGKGFSYTMMRIN